MKQQMNVALEKALNAYLKLDPERFRELNDLQGQCVKIRLTDLSITFFLRFQAEGIQVLSHCRIPPAAVIEGKSIYLLSSVLTDKGARSIHIEGDVELGYQVYGLFKNLNIDWEELLSHYTGDVVAHQVGNLARGFSEAFKIFGNNIRENVVEYAQREAHWLPPRQELEDFYEEVEVLRRQVERVEAYLKQRGLVSG